MDLWTLSDLCTPWSLHVAATLRIANRIAAAGPDSAVTASELASAAGVDPAALTRVLRHLVSKGVFEEPADGAFALNDLACGLLDEGMLLGFDLHGIGGRMARAWSTLPEAVRTGRSAYHEASGGLSFWEDLEAHPDVAESFDALMGIVGHGRPDPNVLLDPSTWTSVQTVVDVGGGSGALLAEVLAAHPNVQGILVDRAGPVGRSAPVFAAASVEPSRVRLCAQSFFDVLPQGGDLYLLKSVLSDWADEEAALILRRCAEAAKPRNGRVVLLNGVSPDERREDPDLLMLVLVSGRTRSLSQFRELARAAGLEVTAAGYAGGTGRFIVEAVAV